MKTTRRQILGAAAAGTLAGWQVRAAGAQAPGKLGIPGPYPGRVVAVKHPGAIISGQYQREPVRDMMRRGMAELTGAPSWQEAWRVFFEPGDVVGIKVNPVGQPYIISKPEVFHEIVAGLEAAGVARRDMVAFDRYKREFLSGGFDKWLLDGMRWAWGTDEAHPLQLDMEGYDADVYVEMAIVSPKANPANPHHRRSYVAKFLTREVNKLVTLGVLKHHQSAGFTVALKNLSHGLANNVARSHVSSSNNACGYFIPAVVDLPVFRQKVVLHVIDGIIGAYHGGPASKTGKFLWDHQTLYFATDPVAVDRVGWTVLDDQRAKMGMAPIAIAQKDDDSVFVRMQPEFVELAGGLGLGVSDEARIDLRRISLG